MSRLPAKSSGNLGILAPSIGGSDEITRVDRAFHEMARQLTASAQALRKQTAILQSILDSMGDGVVVADEKGKFLVFNPAAEQILQMGKTDTPPDHWAARYGVYLPDRVTPCPIDVLPLVRALRGEVVNGAELFVCHSEIPEGRWLSVTARPLKEEEGVAGGGVAVFQDVTERKRAEEAIRTLNDELVQRVLERTAELTEANRQLTQQNQENEMFVYSVSHDLRSPLVNLEGFSRELSTVCGDLRSLLSFTAAIPPAVRERGLALLDGDMAEATRFIQTGVLRLSTIINALLRLSRAGRVEYQCQHVDVDAIVARVVESLSGTIGERGATVRVAELPSLWGDPTAVEQVFANLIGNALNYLDPARPGVVEIGSRSGGADTPVCRDRLADRSVCPSNTEDPSALGTYFVKDNGLGIPAAYKPKIFQAFQRLHPEAAKGEGVGLAMVRRIVERQGGRIWLESTEGVGTTFFLTWPARPSNGDRNCSNPARASSPEMELALCQSNNSSSS